MGVKIDGHGTRNDRVSKTEEVAGQSVFSCYQCGKCSAACPATPEMEMLPNQVVRYLQLGLDEKVFAANTPWICASCLQCQAACPKGIDVPRLMDAVRMLHLRGGENRIDVRGFDRDYLAKAPQIAVVGACRKFLSLS